mmetsp:Transcript_53196/g.108549  ORF Transcript_53196/g.108549 Transcript_53196/m.108549 type:complete len:80 (+) Transcript_53196:1796-2035(+)
MMRTWRLTAQQPKRGQFSLLEDDVSPQQQDRAEKQLSLDQFVPEMSMLTNLALGSAPFCNTPSPPGKARLQLEKKQFNV